MCDHIHDIIRLVDHWNTVNCKYSILSFVDMSGSDKDITSSVEQSEIAANPEKDANTLTEDEKNNHLALINHFLDEETNDKDHYLLKDTLFNQYFAIEKKLKRSRKNKSDNIQYKLKKLDAICYDLRLLFYKVSTKWKLFKQHWYNTITNENSVASENKDVDEANKETAEKGKPDDKKGKKGKKSKASDPSQQFKELPPNIEPKLDESATWKIPILSIPSVEKEALTNNQNTFYRDYFKSIVRPTVVSVLDAIICHVEQVSVNQEQTRSGNTTEVATNYTLLKLQNNEGKLPPLCNFKYV